METLILSEGTLRQSTFDKIGSGQRYNRVLFTEGKYTVDTPLKLNDGTIITAEKNVLITLKDNVNPNVFKKMVPIFGQKNSTIRDITIENIGFFGNDQNQDATPTWRGHSGTASPTRTGQGYHNFIGLKNGANITIRGIYVKKTLGDAARLTNCKGVRYYNNTVIECGHDGLYVDGGSDVEAWGNYTELRTNSAIRLRHVHYGHVHGNQTYNKVGGLASSPGFQFEVSHTSLTSSNILVENNYFEGTYGPAIWIISRLNPSVNAASKITIRKNTFYNCGNMKHISGVGGLTIDGWNDIQILDNTFHSCKGYGVVFGPYVSGAVSAGKGYKAELRNNLFKDTQKSVTVGPGSGAAIANLIPDKYTVKSIDNIFDGNFRNYYNVTGEGDRFGKPCQVFITCKDDQLTTIKKAAGEFQIFRRK